MTTPRSGIELGSTGIRTSALALGCDRLGSVLTPLSTRQCIALVSEARDLGIRHFDTASIYGQGDSERCIGQALKVGRDGVCIASKAGQRLTRSQSIAARFKRPIRLATRLLRGVRGTVQRQRAAGVNYDFSPAYIVESLESSLRRLQTDRVEIFYLHSPPATALWDHALMDALKRQRDLGKIRAIGVSCDDLETALESARHPLVEIVQYTLSDAPACREVMETAVNESKVSIVRGVARNASLKSSDFERNLVNGFLAAMALPSVGGVIMGTTNAQHLRANAGAVFRALGQQEAHA